jgi:hypothetical protein
VASRRQTTNAFLGAFLAIQLLLPIRGFVRSNLDDPNMFTWNMYATTHFVRVRYEAVTPGASPVLVDYKSHFNNRSRAPLAIHRDTLPRFHAYLCRELKRKDPRVRLYGDVKAQLNGGPWVTLVRPGVELCGAPDHGVVPR